MEHLAFAQESTVMDIVVVSVSIMLGLSGVFGLIANGLLILSVLVQPSLRSSPTYVTLVSLATSDIAAILTVSDIIFIFYTGGTADIFCKVFVSGVFASQASVTYHLVTFAILRFIILTKPLFAMKKITATFAVGLCSIVWILSVSYGIPPVFFTGMMTFNTTTNSTVQMCMFPIGGKAFLSVELILFCVIPLALMATFHILKACKVRISEIRPTNAAPRRKVSAKVITGILITFLVANFPACITWAVMVYADEVSSPRSAMTIYLALSPVYLKSFVNPLFYFFFSNKQLQKLFPCLLRKKSPLVS